MGTLGTKSSLANGLGFSKEPFENAKNETVQMKVVSIVGSFQQLKQGPTNLFTLPT